MTVDHNSFVVVLRPRLFEVRMHCGPTGNIAALKNAYLVQDLRVVAGDGNRLLLVKEVLDDGLEVAVVA